MMDPTFYEKGPEDELEPTTVEVVGLGIGTWALSFFAKSAIEFQAMRDYLDRFGVLVERGNPNCVGALVVADFHTQNTIHFIEGVLAPEYGRVLVAPNSKQVGVGRTGYGGDHEFALSQRRDYWGPLVVRMVNAFGQLWTGHLMGTLILEAVGSDDSGHLKIGEELHDGTKLEMGRDANPTVFVLIPVPGDEDDRLKIAAHPGFVEETAERRNAFVLAFDQLSPLATRITWQLQDRMLIRGLWAMIGASAVFGGRSFADMLSNMSMHGTTRGVHRVIGAAAASVPLTRKAFIRPWVPPIPAPEPAPELEFQQGELDRYDDDSTLERRGNRLLHVSWEGELLHEWDAEVQEWSPLYAESFWFKVPYIGPSRPVMPPAPELEIFQPLPPRAPRQGRLLVYDNGTMLYRRGEDLYHVAVDGKTVYHRLVDSQWELMYQVPPEFDTSAVVDKIVEAIVKVHRPDAMMLKGEWVYGAMRYVGLLTGLVREVYGVQISEIMRRVGERLRELDYKNLTVVFTDVQGIADPDYEVLEHHVQALMLGPIEVPITAITETVEWASTRHTRPMAVADDATS